MHREKKVVEYLSSASDEVSVLYAEDQLSLRKVMSRYLLRYFKNVEVVVDGQEAYDKYIQEGPYDLIITDIQMPRMNGMELIEKIKEINIDQEIIVISAFSEQEKLIKAISCGVNGYILKPVDFDALNMSIYNSVFKINQIKENKKFQRDLVEMVDIKSKEVLSLSQEKIENLESSIFALVDLIEKRDTYTAGHSARVAYYSVMLGNALGCSLDELNLLEQAAMLHDIGKVTTPDAILLKPSGLDSMEYTLIQEHVTVGYELLSSIPMYHEHAKIIYAHHEHYDGRGYPKGLKGENIPKLSRIMTIADSFDAMTTQRIYKSRKSITQAMDELQAEAGIAFDPIMINQAIDIFKEIVLPKNTTQLPKNRLEQERYAYYFKDNLYSKFYNDSYFEFMINQNIQIDVSYDTLILMKILNLHAYNKLHGWKAGNIILKDTAKYIASYPKERAYFRLRGDIFVTLTSSIDTDNHVKYLNEYIPRLSEKNVEAEIKKIAFRTKDFAEVDDIEMLF